MDKIILANTNLNNYVLNIDNFKDFIIVISAKDEAKNMVKYFHQKYLLGLKMDVKYRGSYVAVVDFFNNFIYEESSDDAIEYTYSHQEGKIEILSQGYLTGNKSSIKVLNKNGSEQQLSKNARGLNFAVLNSKTLEVIDKFSVDTHLDENLSLNSEYLNKIMSKTKIVIE